jgi:hypothetical protein
MTRLFQEYPPPMPEVVTPFVKKEGLVQSDRAGEKLMKKSLQKLRHFGGEGYDHLQCGLEAKGLTRLPCRGCKAFPPCL